MALNPLTEMVLEFHTAFELHDHTADQPCVPPAPVCLTRVQALVEEWAELLEAAFRSDLAGVLDALCDFQYFLEGTFIACGMTAVRDAEAHDRLITSFTLQRQPCRMPSASELALCSKDILTHVGKMARAMGCGRQADVLLELDNMSRTLDSTWIMCGMLPIRVEAMQEVHRTNMAKLHDDKVVRDASGRVVKPDGWEPPDLAQFLKAPF